MKKIIIQGAGFADNFGDVLFYDIFLKESNQNNVKVDLLNISKQVKQHLEYTEESNNTVINRIKESDGIVFIGGGYLGEPPHVSKYKKYRWGLSKIKDILYVAMLGMYFRKKIIIIGPGAGPISNPITKLIVKKMGNYSQKTMVRDRESYNFLKSIGVRESQLIETVDTAILIKNYYNIVENDNNEKSLVVHLSESPEKSDTTMMLLQEIENFLKNHPEYHLKAITDHNGGGQDRAIAFLKQKYGDKVECHLYEDPEKLLNFLNNSSIVITNKLHIAIVSTVLGKSVLSIPTHQKVLRYFKQINETERCVPYSDIRKNELSNLLEKYHDKKINLDTSVYDKAKINIEFFNKFIKDL